MENDPFIDDFPMNTSIYSGFSMAMLNNQMVHIFSAQMVPEGSLASRPQAWHLDLDTSRIFYVNEGLLHG